MAANSRVLQKHAVFVDVTLSDGTVLTGKVFTPPQARVIDTLNDDRSFLPFETMDGTTLALAKTTIGSVKLPTIAAQVYRGSDPYMILGIAHAATAQEVKDAYRKLCFANHPDRVRGLGFGGDFVELATQNMMRINSAYSHISRTLRIADESASSDKTMDDMRAEGLHAHAARRKAS